MPRSIIELANRNGKPISVDDYVEKFRSILEKDPENRFGLMSIPDAISTAVDLNICSDCHHVDGPTQFREYIGKFRGTSTGILVTTHPLMIEGKLAETNHCRLVTSYNKSGWQVDDVRPDGTIVPAMFSDQYLAERNAQFFHLSQ